MYTFLFPSLLCVVTKIRKKKYLESSLNKNKWMGYEQTGENGKRWLGKWVLLKDHVNDNHEWKLNRMLMKLSLGTLVRKNTPKKCRNGRSEKLEIHTKQVNVTS